MPRYKGSKNRNGTVMCGYCYKNGHNRRGCPDLKAQAKRNPDGYAARSLKEAKKRQCSYCKFQYNSWRPSEEDKGIIKRSYNHDRRTCPQIVKDTRAAHKQNAEHRQAFLDKLNESGLGIGAMIVMEPDRQWDSNYDRDGNEIKYGAGHLDMPNKYFLVTDVGWDEVLYIHGAYPVKMVSMNWLNRKGTNMRSNLRTNHVLDGDLQFEVVSAAPAVEAGMPKNWVKQKTKEVTNYIKNRGK